MFDRLQKKWKVGALQLLLILCTFAIGGSLTGYAGKRIMNLIGLERNPLWFVLYIVIITILWPFAVLLVSVFFGQFRFFTGYLRKMGVRMKIVRGRRHLAIFASGAGSNAQKIIDHFRNNRLAEVALIVCNKPEAGVLAIAQKEGIPVLLIEKDRFFRGDAYVPELKSARINLLVLAGFLWKIPPMLLDQYPKSIVNIHPALLPAHGGKGMYGQRVHEAVIAAGEPVTGITIHYVDEHYDNGDIIFQEKLEVSPADTAASLAVKIHRLEHEHFPRVIEQIIRGS